MRANNPDFWQVRPWKKCEFFYTFANRQFNISADRASDEGEQLYRLVTMAKLVSENPNQCFDNVDFYKLVERYIEKNSWNVTGQVRICDEVIRIVTGLRDKLVVKQLEK